MSTAANGILLVDKAEGWTSHDVVAKARRALGTRKVGHAGTLDPMATGLLLLGSGPATRLLTHLVGLDKTYTATIRLGASTVTDDREGAVLDIADVARIRELEGNTAAIRDAVAGLTGPIEVGGTKWQLEMPGLPILSDEDIAGVLTYIRREWEHAGSAVSPQQVAAVRAQTKSRTRPWTSGELQKPFEIKTVKAK